MSETMKDMQELVNKIYEHVRDAKEVIESTCEHVKCEVVEELASSVIGHLNYALELLDQLVRQAALIHPEKLEKLKSIVESTSYGLIENVFSKCLEAARKVMDKYGICGVARIATFRFVHHYTHTLLDRIFHYSREIIERDIESHVRLVAKVYAEEYNMSLDKAEAIVKEVMDEIRKVLESEDTWKGK